MNPTAIYRSSLTFSLLLEVFVDSSSIFFFTFEATLIHHWVFVDSSLRFFITFSLWRVQQYISLSFMDFAGSWQLSNEIVNGINDDIPGFNTLDKQRAPQKYGRQSNAGYWDAKSASPISDNGGWSARLRSASTSSTPNILLNSLRSCTNLKTWLSLPKSSTSCSVRRIHVAKFMAAGEVADFIKARVVHALWRPSFDVATTSGLKSTSCHRLSFTQKLTQISRSECVVIPSSSRSDACMRRDHSGRNIVVIASGTLSSFLT